MTTTEDKPVDRDAWRRLLDGGDEGPPELTDARIRAKARQALMPRSGRWWLPASLAASLLLAVLLVQRQYETPGAPAIVSESDYATPPARSPAPDRQDQSLAHAAPEQQEEPAPASARREGNQANTPTTAITQQRVAEAEAARDRSFVAPAPPVVPPPLDLPATSEARVSSGATASGPATDAAPAPAARAPAAPAAEAKREEAVGETLVTGSRRRVGSLESTTPVTQATGADVNDRSGAIAGGLMKSGVAERSPEEWYAAIEKLRAAGKKREAKLELKKLEEAHPGWLEENHPTDR